MNITSPASKRCCATDRFMPRYFLEVSYRGTNYSGFQTQQNAVTIQSEIEKALAVLKGDLSPVLTGSSRTDAGVHALQNYFHFDTDMPVTHWRDIIDQDRFLYKLNAILPADIVVKSIQQVIETAHCRFDALSREYKYHIYGSKDPFLAGRSYYFPYRLDREKMNEAAAIIIEYTDFSSFSKRNTQVKSFLCQVQKSQWIDTANELIYNVKANRFLRGMVRALTATMLQVGRGKMTIAEFREVIEAKDCTKASFAVPAHGLYLVAVNYPDSYFK